LPAELGANRCHLVNCDLRDVAAIREIYRQVDAVGHGLNVLDDNAAVTGWTPDILNVSEEDWDNIYDANLKDAFFNARQAAQNLDGERFDRFRWRHRHLITA
jgi:NAD(P)-dependent dehydrogenase (short-subunit alcohol dehydrogenase family)